MVSKHKLIINIFTHPYINKKLWIFKANIDWSKTEVEIDKDDDNYIEWKNGIWHNGIWFDGKWEHGKGRNGVWYDGIWITGIWYNGTWKNGRWNNGFWKSGNWEGGYWINGCIYNPKTNKYKLSKLPPNKCKWSLSYGK